MKFPRVIAHRGACAYAPENTMASFQKAHDMGATWVETDVMLTKDLVPVLNHDDSLKRTVGVDVLISSTPSTELDQYTFKGEHIPHLDTLLTFLMKNNMGLNLELKPTLNMEKETARIAMQAVIESGFPKDRLLITSFSMIAVETAHAYAPQYHYGWLSDNDRNMQIGLASKIPFVTMNIDEKRASRALVAELNAKGYQVLSFTVDDRKRAEALFKMGVDAIFSNMPDLLD
ncbi:MAG: glycerophosphodiester phosphodiesterase [Gammaproteobacteria bacterium]